MNEKERIKLNFASYEFYSLEITKSESKFLTEFDRVVGLEQWSEVDKLIEMAKNYLKLSHKFLAEISNLEEQIPALFRELETTDDGSPKELGKQIANAEFEDAYERTIEGTKASQLNVHKKVMIKIELLERIQQEGGYGSYE